MARNAVTISFTVFLSLSLLSSARLDPSAAAAAAAAVAKDEIATSTPSWDPQSAEEKEKSGSSSIKLDAVDLLHHPVYLTADQIAHSFRLPSGGRRHVALPLRPSLEISYGNDMVTEERVEEGKMVEKKLKMEPERGL